MREPELNIVDRLIKMLRPGQLTVVVLADRTGKSVRWLDKVLRKNRNMFELVEAGNCVKSATWKLKEWT